jgi:type IV secretion system protein VirB8
MTELKRDPNRQAYYAEAASWSADVHGALRASRRTAWRVAAAACGVALLEGVALAALAPLKTVVPFAISVDRQTGYVETVRPLAPGAMSQDQAVTEANLVQYVLARETFDPTDLREAYRKVTLWSAGDAREQYMALMRKTTPESPLNLYGAHTVVETTVRSVSLLSPTTAIVRFDTTRRDATGSGQTRPWVAAISFRYTGAPMSMGDRFLDPLGFQVTRYSRDAEAPVPPGSEATAAPAASNAYVAPTSRLPAAAPVATPPPALAGPIQPQAPAANGLPQALTPSVLPDTAQQPAGAR